MSQQWKFLKKNNATMNAAKLCTKFREWTIWRAELAALPASSAKIGDGQARLQDGSAGWFTLNDLNKLKRLQIVRTLQRELPMYVSRSH